MTIQTLIEGLRGQERLLPFRGLELSSQHSQQLAQITCDFSPRRIWHLWTLQILKQILPSDTELKIKTNNFLLRNSFGIVPEIQRLSSFASRFFPVTLTCANFWGALTEHGLLLDSHSTLGGEQRNMENSVSCCRLSIFFYNFKSLSTSGVQTGGPLGLARQPNWPIWSRNKVGGSRGGTRRLWGGLNEKDHHRLINWNVWSPVDRAFEKDQETQLCWKRCVCGVIICRLGLSPGCPVPLRDKSRPFPPTTPLSLRQADPPTPPFFWRGSFCFFPFSLFPPFSLLPFPSPSTTH